MSRTAGAPPVDGPDEQRALLDRLRRLRELQLAREQREQQRWRPYRDDPAGWVETRLRGELWSAQRRILESLRDHPRTVVRACHGAGKSYTAAAAAAWWIDVHDPGEAFVVSTAPTGAQVRAVLWREVRRIHRRGALPGRVTDAAEWKLDDGELVGLGRKPADHNEHGFQGIHAPAVLLIIDEACGVPAQLWTAAKAIATNPRSRILAIGNPDDPSSEMARASRPGSGWNTLRIDAFDLPTVTRASLEHAAAELSIPAETTARVLDEYDASPAAGREGEQVGDHLADSLTSAAWIMEAARDWRVGTPLWNAKVRAEWPEGSEDSVVPLAWVTRAQERALDADDDAPNVLGVDVARYGRDLAAVYHRHGPRIRRVETRESTSTVEVAGMARRALRETGATVANVDVGGVGGGVVDQLDAEGEPVAGVDFGARPRDSERFADRRAELYWGLRERLEPDAQGHADADLDPADEQLAAELSSIRYGYDARSRVRIESKEDMRRRGLDSPDHADAVALTEAGEHGAATRSRRARAAGTRAGRRRR